MIGSFFGKLFEAICRLVGAALVLFVLACVMSFLGCRDSDGPGTSFDYSSPIDPPALTDLELPSPSPIYDLPPPPDLQP